MRTTLLAMVLLAAVAASAAGGTDEIAELVAEAKLPDRFADHRASFRVVDESVEFPDFRGGTKTFKYRAVKDGDRYVAVYIEGGKLNFIAHDPTRATKKLPERNRYSLVCLFGTRYITVPYYYGWAATGSEHRTRFECDGDSVTLTEWQRWTGKPDAVSEHVHTIKLHPKLGYVIESTCTLDTADEPGNKLYENINQLPMDLASYWPDEWQYDYTGISPVGQEGYLGWANNWPAADRSDADNRLKIRNGGLVVFVPRAGSDTWTQALSRWSDDGVTHVNKTCNVWMDQHNEFRLPAEPDADGRFRVTVRYRFAHLPPEVTELVRKRMRLMDFGGARAVMVRIGVLEDFEDQPLPLTSPVRGWPVKLTSDEARSGDKSAVFEATTPLTAPREAVVPLKKGRRYRLSGYVKATGQARARLELSTWFAGAVATETVSPGQGWKKVSVGYSPAYSHSTTLRVHVSGEGRCYLDDFRFVKLERGEP